MTTNTNEFIQVTSGTFIQSVFDDIEDTRTLANVTYTITSDTNDISLLISPESLLKSATKKVESKVQPKSNLKKEISKEERIQNWKREGYIIKKKRTHVSEVIIGPNDILIAIDSYNRPKIFHTQGGKKGTVGELMTNNIPSSKYSDDYKELTTTCFFDKNMNPLELKVPFPLNQTKMFPLLNVNQIDRANFLNGMDGIGSNIWIIVDKKKFLRSKGKDFVIRQKHNISYDIIKSVKKKLIKNFVFQEELLNKLKEIIGGIYDEDKFEIIYFQTFHNSNKFYIFNVFNDLIIKNSIEIEHKIHTLITKLNGTHDILDNDKSVFNFRPRLEGIRLVYNPVDSFYSYTHSHISRGNMGHMANFCMGGNNFLSHMIGDSVTDVEFEGIMISLFDHISWESLEGGPYFKMEDIGKSSSQIFIIMNELRLRLYDKESLKNIFDFLSSIDLSPLKKAFTLTNPTKDGLTYLLDKDVFYEEFCKFWKKVVSVAKAKIENIDSMYINGEYIQPAIVEIENFKNDFRSSSSYPFINPDTIDIIMKYFHFQINKELKNDKQKRKDYISDIRNAEQRKTDSSE
jgi:hypothetical protein